MTAMTPDDRPEGATTTDTGPTPAASGPPTGERALPTSPRARLAGYSELIVPALVIALATFFTHGTVTMEVVGYSVPGPQFFPAIVCGLLYAMAIILTIQILRKPKAPDVTDDATNADFSAELLTDLGSLDTQLHQVVEGRTPGRKLPPTWRTYTDWRTVGSIVGALVVTIVALPFVGWILTAAFLFWVVSWALGSKRPLFDVAVALLFASLIQLAFNGLLGLALPAGFLEGLI